jgi:hypothetical protein
LDQEYGIIKPKKIVAMGSVAYSSLKDRWKDKKILYIWHYSYIFNHKRNLIDEYIKQLLRVFNDK